MSKYLVNMDGAITIQVPVEAASKEEAMERVYDVLDEYFKEDDCISAKDIEWESYDAILDEI